MALIVIPVVILKTSHQQQRGLTKTTEESNGRSVADLARELAADGRHRFIGDCS